MILIDAATLERATQYALACFRVTTSISCNDFIMVVTDCCIRLYQTLFFHPHTIKESLARETNPLIHTLYSYNIYGTSKDKLRFLL